MVINMNFLTDEQALAKTNNTAWFENKSKPQPIKQNKKLIDLDSDELEEILKNREFTLNEYKSLDAETRGLLMNDIKHNFYLVSRIKRILTERRGVVKENKPVDDKSAELEEFKKKYKNFIETKNNEIANLKEKLESKIAFQEDKIKKLGETLYDKDLKQNQKIKNIEESNRMTRKIHSCFKDLIKEQYGMTLYLELIQEADRRAEAELNQ